MSQHIEMIVDYLVVGDDFQYHDNHGVLIRCKDCRFNRIPATSGNADCEKLYGMTDQNGFCSLAMRREE